MRAFILPLLASAFVAAGAQAPADYGPVSVDLADIQYPHPVSTLAFRVYGQDVRMAYMDVKPTGQANGQTVVLLHGYNFTGESWRGTIEFDPKPSPYNVSFTGTACSEPKLIELAFAFEQATKKRIAPPLFP